MIFQSNRLIYRCFEDSDVDQLHTFWGDPEVMAQCGGVSNPSNERFLKTINFYKSLFADKGYSVFAIIEKSSQTLIGAAGFNPGDNDSKIELIYHLAKDYWGYGYGTEAAKACINFAYSLQSIKTIVASIDPQNIGSKKILEDVGFTYQGMKWFEDTQQEEPTYAYFLD